jgi:hypothetical protein
MRASRWWRFIIKTLDELVPKLPPDLQREVEDFARFLLETRGPSKGARLRMDWAGALWEFREQFTSLELQKKALEWARTGARGWGLGARERPLTTNPCPIDRKFPTQGRTTRCSASFPKWDKDDGRSSQFGPGSVPRGRLKRTRAEGQQPARFSETRRGLSRRGHGDLWQGDYAAGAARAAKGLSNCDRGGRQAWRDPGPGKVRRFPTTTIIPLGMNNLARPPAGGPIPFPDQI